MYLYKDIALSLNSRVIDSIKIIRGIGIIKSYYLVNILGLGLHFRINYLNRYLYELIMFLIKKFYITDERLVLYINQRILLMYNIGSVRGLRLSRGLPVHGQRTRSNSNTARRLLRLRINL